MFSSSREIAAVIGALIHRKRPQAGYFNYIQDPWGSWCEYACGIDFIPAYETWSHKDHPLEDGFYLWGPDLPPDFVVNYEARS